MGSLHVYLTSFWVTETITKQRGFRGRENKEQLFYCVCADMMVWFHNSFNTQNIKLSLWSTSSASPPSESAKKKKEKRSSEYVAFICCNLCYGVQVYFFLSEQLALHLLFVFLPQPVSIKTTCCVFADRPFSTTVFRFVHLISKHSELFN